MAKSLSAVEQWQKLTSKHVYTHVYSGKRYGGKPFKYTQNVLNRSVEIDLGSDQVVTHLGTAGRLPKMVMFPAPEMLRTSDFKVLPYQGPYWKVTDYKYDHQFVTRYKVLGRRDKRGEWFEVGEFRGNNESFSEVVNALNGDTGVTCRYLRIKPLEHSPNGCSFRFALYSSKAHQEKNSRP